MPAIHRRSRYPLALLLQLLLPATLAAQQPRPHGVWQLDPAHSDSTAATFKLGDTPMGPPPGERPGDPGPGYGPAGGGGIGGGMGGGRRFGGGRYHHSPSEKEITRIRQTIELSHQAAERVRIDVESGTFTTTDASGTEQSWRINGKTVTQHVEGSGDVKTRVHWKGDALLVERKVDGGGRVVESYGLGLDGSRMIVFVEVELGMMQTSSTRRYSPLIE